eukprot:TRINITY_DN5199_c0_g1_i3.p1 TRINITY_DN5199_c0_g1~~TRINITY_DN5199_c0_g1_i3.p1  ORF type:complete len:246 (-),score=35.24 TRINITY_DN5199_c0_g1_i3:59-796(-)
MVQRNEERLCVNDLFCFQPSTKKTFSFQEAAYQWAKGRLTSEEFVLHHEFYDILVVPGTSEGKDERPTKERQEDDEEGFAPQADPGEFEAMLKAKSNYDFFFNEVLSLKDYCKPMPAAEFFQVMIDRKTVSLDNLLGYFHLRDREYLVELGHYYGFDFLLYKQEEGKSIDDFQHTHSPFAVSLHRGGTSLKTKRISRLIRIATNYNKTLVLIEVTPPDVAGSKDIRSIYKETTFRSVSLKKSSLL